MEDQKSPLDEFLRKKEKQRIRFILTIPLWFVLAVFMCAAILFYYIGYQKIALSIPLLIVLAGIIVIFFGSFSDFGAKKYLANVMITKASLRENDVTDINKEQLVMNIIFIGIGLFYVICGIMIYYFFTGII